MIMQTVRETLRVIGASAATVAITSDLDLPPSRQRDQPRQHSDYDETVPAVASHASSKEAFEAGLCALPFHIAPSLLPCPIRHALL
ncbi:hypothetical protein IG631_24297 [Alternaria alternata]|nr:hypothetical protein IG631_24297 [Alternaria alternata]